MRRLIVCVVAVLTLAVMPAAWGHPSENRADQSTFGGPHCHTNLKSESFAFPSHRAHLASNAASAFVFMAAECPE